MLLFLVTGRMPRSGNLPVLFLLSSQKSAFCPYRKNYELDPKMDDTFCRWRHKVRKLAVDILQTVNNRTQSWREILRMVIIDIVILGRVTLDPAGMHCPSWDVLLFLVFVCLPRCESGALFVRG